MEWRGSIGKDNRKRGPAGPRQHATVEGTGQYETGAALPSWISTRKRATLARRKVSISTGWPSIVAWAPAALPIRTSSVLSLRYDFCVPAGRMPYSRREPSAAVTSTQLAEGRLSVRPCAPTPLAGSAAGEGAATVARGDLAALWSSGG